MARSDSPRDVAHHRDDPLAHALPTGAGGPGSLISVKPAALLRVEDAGVTAHVDRPCLPERDVSSLPSVAAVVPLRRKALRA